MQIHLPRYAIIAQRLRRKAVQMRLVSRADGKGGGVNLDKSSIRQPCPLRRQDTVSRQQQWAAVGVSLGIPPRVLHDFGYPLEICKKLS
jgi:hypothetical protein